MKLDKHIVDMFADLTKPTDDVKMEKTCYGTISVIDGTRYVKLDGSDLLVPAASTVKTSHGDRVTVLMKNHTVTITGNLTTPATDGGTGEAGTAATIEIGTVTTGEAGSSASVTNSGTTSKAIFDFVIPKGDKGDPGPQGPKGEKGDTGAWDGTIPEHSHDVSDITDFPESLPANGGNADTLNGFHASIDGTCGVVTTTSDYGVTEVGKYVDFHTAAGQDFDGRLVKDDNGFWFFNADNSKATVYANLAGNANSSYIANHQLGIVLPVSTDILSWAASDECPFNCTTKVRIFNGPACPTNYGYSAENNDFMYTINKIDVNTWIRIKAHDNRSNNEFVNSRLDGVWTGWMRCNDGGNADTVNGRGTNGNTSLIRYDCLNSITDADTHISTGIYNGVFTNYPSELRDGQGTLVVINYIEANNETTGRMGDAADRWIRQWFITPYANDVYCRSCVESRVSDWDRVVKSSELIPKDLTNSISISTDSSFNLFTTSLKKIGNICTLSLNVTTNAVISNPMMTIGTLPESARPSTKIEHNTLSNNKGEVCWVSINTDGRLSVVKLSNTATWNSSDGVRTCITYMVDS